jgi:iron complex transport system substrate-binding protein
MNKFLKILFLFFLAAIFFNCPVFAQRIISLGPAITEGLYLLDLGDSLVADTTYCRRPEDAAKKEKIGNLLDINLEKVAALKPDLILATSLTPALILEKLKNLGYKVEVFSQAKNFDELCSEFIRLGKLTGKIEKAGQIVKEVRMKAADLPDNHSKLRPEVFLEIGVNPLFTVNKDSYLSNMIEMAGGVNVCKGVANGIYSREQVVQDNPDVIVIMDMGISSLEEKKSWQKYSNISAVKNNRIYLMDSYKLGSVTPVTFVETAKELAAMIRPAEGN